MKKSFPFLTGFRFIMMCCLMPIAATAQLKGGHLLGALGLKSGSQAPENTLTVLTPVYFYNAKSLRNSDGDEIAKPDISMFIAAPGVNWVSDIKILGANYGAAILLPFASNRLDSNIIESHSDFAYSDTYIQPIQLGWHKKRADFFAGYQLYIPTGKYEVGGSNNSGLGMWINEFSGGTTVYLTPDKKWHFATLLSYEIHGKKKDTDIKTGDILNIEGGLGKTFYVMGSDTAAPKSIINAGLIYYMQLKTTGDEIPVGPIIINPEKDRVYALGAEANLLHVSSSTTFGFRWFGELSAINRFKGNTFFISLAYTFATNK
ncbi:SphA family protein [Flavobacterium hauense]